MKTYTFLLLARDRGLSRQLDEYSTRCYTLAEAQAELRHFIRVNHPELFNHPAGFGYITKVTP